MSIIHYSLPAQYYDDFKAPEFAISHNCANAINVATFFYELLTSNFEKPQVILKQKFTIIAPGARVDINGDPPFSYPPLFYELMFVDFKQ